MVEPAERASAVNGIGKEVQIRNSETVCFCEKPPNYCGLSPAPRARLIVLHLIPGLAPGALCSRALRALFCDDVYVSQLYDYRFKRFRLFISRLAATWLKPGVNEIKYANIVNVVLR
jgi:hypothetical protein